MERRAEDLNLRSACTDSVFEPSAVAGPEGLSKPIRPWVRTPRASTASAQTAWGLECSSSPFRTVRIQTVSYFAFTIALTASTGVPGDLAEIRNVRELALPAATCITTLMVTCAAGARLPVE